MIYRIMFLIISVMVLQGCSVLSQEVNLSSGIQYIGGNEKIIFELENFGINYQSSSEIDTEATDKKLILIEPYHIKDISKEEVEIALITGKILQSTIL